MMMRHALGRSRAPSSACSSDIRWPAPARRPRLLAAGAAADASPPHDAEDDQAPKKTRGRKRRWPDAMPIPERLPLGRYARALAQRLSAPAAAAKNDDADRNDNAAAAAQDRPRVLLVATGNLAASKAVGVLVDAVRRGERGLGFSALVAVAVAREDPLCGAVAARREAEDGAAAAAAAAAGGWGSLAADAEAVAAPAAREVEKEARMKARVPSRDDVFCFYTWSVPHAVGPEEEEEEEENERAAGEEGSSGDDGDGDGDGDVDVSSSSPVLVASARSPPIALARRIDAEVSRAGFAVVEAAMGPAAVGALRAVAMASERRSGGAAGGGAAGGGGGGGGGDSDGDEPGGGGGGGLGFHAGVFRAPDVRTKVLSGAANPPRSLRLLRLTVVPLPEEWWWA